MKLSKLKLTAALILLCSCGDTGPVQRDGPGLAAWISELPVPETAETNYLRDTFVEAGGEKHNQGVIEVRLTVDSVTMELLLRVAATKDYKPIVSDSLGGVKVSALTAAPGGLFRVQGEFHSDYSLVVLNPNDRTISVKLLRSTGMP